MKDLSGGVYEAPLEVPSDAKGEIKVSVASPTGVTSLIRVKVGAEVVAPAPAPVPAPVEPAPAPVPAPVPGPVVTPQPTKPPVAAGERPWLRVRASFVGSTYAYKQEPAADSGPLLPQSIAIGKAYGGTNATPLGAEGDVRLWLPMFRYVGFHGSVRSTQYAFETAQLTGVARDNLLDVQADVTGRYYADIGATELWGGAKVGFRHTDFIYFKGCLEPSCVVEYVPLTRNGFQVAAEGGVEFGRFYANTTVGGAFALSPYLFNVDANVGVHIIKYWTVDAGFTGVWRGNELEGADSGVVRGTLTDNQLLFKIGTGFAY
jgi:hypothetical protein